MKEKIGSIEAITMIFIIVMNHIIISYPKNIVSVTNSASIINIVFISILAFLFVFFISRMLFKFHGLDIIKISDFLGGKALKYITGILFLLYFLFVLSTTLRSFCESLKIIYFQNYSIIFLIGIFVLSIIACNYLGMKSIIRSNLIIAPLLIVSIIFIFFANFKNFNFSNIYPLFGNGIFTTFFSGMSNLYAFSAIAVIYFLPPYLKNTNEIKKISYISIILSGIMLLLSVSSVLLIFSNLENIEQILPIYLLARLIEFGRFFQRIDAVFLLIWIISIISYLSFTVSICNNVFKELFNIENSNMLINTFGLLILGISLIPKNLVQVRFLENTIYRYIVLGLVFIFAFIILLLANLKLKKHSIERRGSEN